MKLRALALAIAAAILAVPAIAEDLGLSIGSRGDGPAVERCFERFAATHPEITIIWNKVSAVPHVPGVTRELFVTGPTARSPTPDVFTIDVIWAGEFAQHGWLEPLNGPLAEGRLAPSSARGSCLSASTLDGKVHAFPLYADKNPFFYRSDPREKNGLEVPTTWEDVMAASQTTTQAENNPLSAANGPEAGKFDDTRVPTFAGASGRQQHHDVLLVLRDQSELRNQGSGGDVP